MDRLQKLDALRSLISRRGIDFLVIPSTGPNFSDQVPDHWKIIEWLTGFDEKKLKALIEEKVTFKTFFGRATLHPNAHLITGLICGYRIEDLENPITRQTRYLDKLVDELAVQRRDILAINLASNPAIALDYMIFALSLIHI